MIYTLAPLIILFIISLPSLIYSRPRKTFLLLSLFALIVEFIGVKTGFPYGSFHYIGNVGPMILDTIPLSLIFAWPPLVIGAHVISSRFFSSKTKQLIFSIFLLLILDLFLDPSAVYLRLWEYKNPYPGILNVPFSNFLGWIISGTIGTLICQKYLDLKSTDIKSSLSYIANLFIFIPIFIYVLYTSL